MTHYHAGQNIPGYLPMDDVPYAFDSFDAAKASMIEDLDRSRDAIFEAGETEDERAIADEYSAAMEELNLCNGPEWSTHLPLTTSEHDLGLAFWIVQCDEEGCQNEDDADGQVSA